MRQANLLRMTGITILATLVVGLLVWWFAFASSATTPTASAREIVTTACDIEHPNFDIVGTIRQEPFLYKGLIDFKVEVSGKDYRVQLRLDEEVAEYLHVDGIVLQREGTEGAWEESPLTYNHWLARLIGMAPGEGTVCMPVRNTHFVGEETLEEVSTKKYAWAYNWIKDERVPGTANDDPWSHKWEVWLDELGQMVQIQTSTKDPQKPFVTTEDWDIVTAKIVGVGEENVITKPTG